MSDVIKESELRKKAALSTTFAKGAALFHMESVYEMDMELISSNEIVVTATVEGSQKRDYDVSFRVAVGAAAGKLRECSCHCEAFENYGGLCKHLVSAVLEFNFVMQLEELKVLRKEYEEGEIVSLVQDGQILEYVKEELVEEIPKKGLGNYEDTIRINQYPSSAIQTSSGRTFTSTPSEMPSSRPILDVMSAIALKERSRFCLENVDGDVELEPTLLLEVAEERLELRIGKKQMYVVKNIRELVADIKAQRYVQYGKKLAFVHAQSAFSKETQPLVSMLMNVPFQEEAIYYGYPSRMDGVRSLKLDAYLLDELMTLYEGKKLYVQTPLTYNKEFVPVVRENPVLPLNIEGINNGKGARLQFPKLLMLEGVHDMYIYWNSSIYICSEKYSEEMRDIIGMIAHNWLRNERKRGYHSYMGKNQQQQELGERDYSSFCTTMLPLLEKYMDVRIQNIDFSRYQIEEGLYELYFDLGEEQEVLCMAKAKYGDKEHSLLRPAKLTETYRDIRSEYELRVLLTQYFPEKTRDGQTYLLRNDDERLAALIENGMGQLQTMAEVFMSDEFRRIRISSNVSVRAGLSVKGELLQVSWDVSGMSMDELAEVLNSYKRKKRYHRLRNGEFLRLADTGLDALADMQEDLSLTKTQIKEGMAQVPLYRALYLEALMRENKARIQVSMDEQFEKLTQRFEHLKEKVYSLPEGIHAKLRPYQEEGYQWASLLAELGFGGILADDMGLGKTLQMIAYMCSNKEGTHLVVCPASLVYNWESEFHKFVPDCKVCAIVGTAMERRRMIEQYAQYEVVITSYDLLKRDIEYYEGRHFACEILDEAQYIKNPATQAAKAVKAIESTTRFALTGTPIENRLSELWSIFEYLMPGYLYSYKHFKEHFEEQIMQGGEASEKKALTKLHAMVQPFLLRRLKQDVLTELPDKIEEIVYSKCTSEQEKLYQAAEKKLLMSIGKKSGREFQESRMQILAELTRLRQLCCDPALLYDNYKGGSAKLDTCLEMVESAIEGGHRILLFSQFTTMLDVLAGELKRRGIRYFLLTGSTSKRKRRALVEQFQEKKAEVFLISLKAGGTGLNLTAADMVIHYDPWWNVAAQNQATDRAHRIGQGNRVTVIKLIARNTIEERIMKLQEKKQDLADKIVSEEGMSLSAMTKEELLSILQ